MTPGQGTRRCRAAMVSRFRRSHGGGSPANPSGVTGLTRARKPCGGHPGPDRVDSGCECDNPSTPCGGLAQDSERRDNSRIVKTGSRPMVYAALRRAPETVRDIRCSGPVCARRGPSARAALRNRHAGRGTDCRTPGPRWGITRRAWVSRPRKRRPRSSAAPNPVGLGPRRPESARGTTLAKRTYRCNRNRPMCRRWLQISRGSQFRGDQPSRAARGAREKQ